MCFPMECLSIVPLLWLITMPLFGSFCGPEVVLRLSLMMMLHTLIGAALPGVLVSLIPFFQTALFCIILALPITVVPYLFLWVYDKLIWLSEPVFLTIEAVELVRVSVRTSSRMAEQIEEQPLLMKSLILGAAGISYLLSVIIGYALLSSSTPAVRWILAALVVVSVVLLLLTLMKEEGIISDCGIATLAMFSILWAMQQESNMMAHPMKVPEEWINASSDEKSFLQLLLSMATMGFARVTLAFSFLRNLFSASFLLLVAIRVLSVIHVASLVARRITEQSDDYDDSSDEMPPSAWHSPCMVKLALIFVYTQLVVYNIEVSTKPLSYTASGPIMEVATKGLVQKVGVSRLVQLCVLIGTYVYRLYHPDEFVFDY
ncbi:uncharacterized protein LOC110986742 isoform X2 [Acanthaster planci]|uniref:Uncharacterized protein LOC110986742 isoform X2 n=1 Tax=Acanthaster planci TaxID=133434 RepID=A0A8B7ZML0_ACAPL|nr:uncharacterized protein LOC110986742 isoform X2 [Acanthaster planci]